MCMCVSSCCVPLLTVWTSDVRVFVHSEWKRRRKSFSLSVDTLLPNYTYFNTEISLTAYSVVNPAFWVLRDDVHGPEWNPVWQLVIGQWEWWYCMIGCKALNKITRYQKMPNLYGDCAWLYLTILFTKIICTNVNTYGLNNVINPFCLD